MSRAAELAKFIGDGTLGLGGAEDKKLVFDGNAQDYHVGLDDSEDKLTIGKGTALGTTAHMTFDADGQILKPLQPCFLVNAGSNTNNVAVGSDTTVTFGSEVFDVGSNFASNTFTAPVTGKYLFTVSLRIDTFDSAASYMVLKLKTSNREYSQIVDKRQTNGDTEYNTMRVTAIADMDDNDTCFIFIKQVDGTAQADVVDDASLTFFSGYLLG